jgi:hypothetical protein
VFRDADKKPLTLAVSGPSEGKTVQVIRDAIKLTKKTLPQLKLIYVGGVDAAREVETAVKEAGGSFVHAPF